MRFMSLSTGLVFALSLPTGALAQNAQGDVPSQDSAARTPATDNRIHLKYGVFDPLAGLPMVEETLLAAADTNLYIVQFDYAFIDADRNALRELGGKLHAPLPHNALIVRMDSAAAAAAQNIEGVRWVGDYQPAYRLEGDLLTAISTGGELPAQNYNMVMADKANDKAALGAKIAALGGEVVDEHRGSLLFTAKLTKAQLIMAARLDEVLWIDRETAKELDMDNARDVQGSDYLDTVAGYDGDGNGSGRIRGHVYEGVESNHPDFVVPMVNVRSGGQAQSHGHCTAGIIFSDGTASGANAVGHAPGARGYYTNYSTVTAGWSRNQVISDVVNVHNCLFTTASWGNTRTTQYTSISADADDIVFDHRIPWTQSQSNAGNQNSRPQAWGKNIISVGALRHYNDNNPGNDQWANGASIGPAADGRIKPDLCNFYDSVGTSDRSGSAGYASGSFFSGFSGTSAATPITAGLNALAIEMFTDHIFGNSPRVNGGSDFQNRPYAQTVKALQIANASLYPWGVGAGQAIRDWQGWGYGNVRTMYDNRARHFIVPEDRPIQQGQTHTYFIDVAPGTSMLKIAMSYLDPAGPVSPAISRINNLNMQVRRPNGLLYWGNNGLKSGNTSQVGGGSDTLDTVEVFVMPNPQAGQWRIQITAPTIAQDAHVATGATDATYALVASGGTAAQTGCARYIPDNDPTSGTINTIPFGTTSSGSTGLTSLFASNNGGSVGGTIFFDITASGTDNIWLAGIDVNVNGTSAPVGTPLEADIYYDFNSTYAGIETTPGAWTTWTAAKGVSAGQDLESRLVFNRPIQISAGQTFAIAVVARNFAHRYTNGANTFNDSNVTIDLGSATNEAFGPSVFNPRSGNVTVRYAVDGGAGINCHYQQVLRSADLGGAGAITDLAFAPSATARHYNRTMRIRMAHRPAGYVMSTTFSNNISGYTTVLNESWYSWNTESDTWTQVGLENPFNYNGTSDVVVEIFLTGNLALEGSTGGFRRGTEQRLFNWTFPYTSLPTTGTLGNAGTKIRAEFGCGGGNEFDTACGPLTASHTGNGQPGTTFRYVMNDGVPSSGAIIQLGFNNTRTSLNTFGFTNCNQWNDNVASVFKFTNASGSANHPISLPSTAAFNGLVIHGHWYNFDASAPAGITVSNSTRLIIGEAP